MYTEQSIEHSRGTRTNNREKASKSYGFGKTLSFRAVINACIRVASYLIPSSQRFLITWRTNFTNYARPNRVDQMHFCSHLELDSIRTIIMIQLRKVIRMHINLIPLHSFRSLFFSVFSLLRSGRWEIMYARNSPFHIICYRFLFAVFLSLSLSFFSFISFLELEKVALALIRIRPKKNGSNANCKMGENGVSINLYLRQYIPSNTANANRTSIFMIRTNTRQHNPERRFYCYIDQVSSLQQQQEQKVSTIRQRIHLYSPAHSFVFASGSQNGVAPLASIPILNKVIIH